MSSSDISYIAPLFQGFITTAGLIIAIGAQNAFVLKQGIFKNHVLITVLICSIIDAILIFIGVCGFGAALNSNALLLAIAKWGGVAFLFWYGLRSFIASYKTESLKINTNQPNLPNRRQSIISCLLFSLLNPHVYIDSIMLIGSIGAQFKPQSRLLFAVGAIIASTVWFFSLGYGARFLAPLFRKPVTWKILDFIIGVIMWSIAITLAVAL